MIEDPAFLIISQQLYCLSRVDILTWGVSFNNYLILFFFSSLFVSHGSRKLRSNINWLLIPPRAEILPDIWKHCSCTSLIFRSGFALDYMRKGIKIHATVFKIGKCFLSRFPPKTETYTILSFDHFLPEEWPQFKLQKAKRENIQNVHKGSSFTNSLINEGWRVLLSFQDSDLYL